MNNTNVIRLMNENGVAQEYGQIPDLWHIAQAIADGQDFGYLDPKICAEHSKQILQVWHMAHDLKACIEGQGQAVVLSANILGETIHKDDDVIKGLGQYLRNHNLDVTYCIDDDGLHVTRGGRLIWKGWAEDMPTGDESNKTEEKQ